MKTTQAETLQAYHDGELSWLARRRVERRLARDPDARRELEGMRSLGSLLLLRRAEPASQRLDCDLH